MVATTFWWRLMGLVRSRAVGIGFPVEGAGKR